MQQSMKVSVGVGVALGVLLLAGAWYQDHGGFVLRSAYPRLSGGVYEEPLKAQGTSWLIPPDEAVESNRTPETTPALTTPKMIGLNQVTRLYFDDIPGVAVEVNGDARFYSAQILNWHEVVYDVVGGERVVITYSTLCGAGVAYQTDLPLALSGRVYNNCPLLDDGQGNWYAQVSGVQVKGNAVGTTLPRAQASVELFGDWRARHPDGQLLSLETGYERVYSRHPYGAYDTANSTPLYYPVNHRDEQLDNKDLMWDILDTSGQKRLNIGISRAWLSQSQVLNAVGAENTPVVVFLDNVTASPRSFLAQVDGRTLTFKLHEGGRRFVDNETGSVWNKEGVAESGELKGKSLVALPMTRMFAFAYVTNFPLAQLPGRPEVKEENTSAAAEGDTLIVQ